MYKVYFQVPAGAFRFSCVRATLDEAQAQAQALTGALGVNTIVKGDDGATSITFRPEPRRIRTLVLRALNYTTGEVLERYKPYSDRVSVTQALDNFKREVRRKEYFQPEDEVKYEARIDEEGR